MSMFFCRYTALAPSATRAFSSTSRASLARMQIIGRLGTQPELQPTSTGQSFVRYVVASDHGRADNRHTSWYRVAAFVDGPRKDFLMNLPKGTLVHVEADATLNVYEETETQKKHNRLSLYQRSIDVLSRPHVPEQEPAHEEEIPQAA